MSGEFRFSFGPWNIHEGADPFGPTVRGSIPFGTKLTMYKKLGFDGVTDRDFLFSSDPKCATLSS